MSFRVRMYFRERMQYCTHFLYFVRTLAKHNFCIDEGKLCSQDLKYVVLFWRQLNKKI